jgi:tetratricopeptide (TPR) repeat protein
MNKSILSEGADEKERAVSVRAEEVVFPTYLPDAPDKNPMFLEKRVYQGSSGAVYPLPFTGRISETKTDRKWKGVWIENKYVRVLLLPEIGGRIHAIQDKTNGYDLIYNQTVIKPALVGLNGPWASGGIEFNWPQHHRPATFLPTDVEIEEHADGSKTVWCSDHDPMCRMKGMHGVCLHPDNALVELKVRAYNRTPYVQTFLWWANVATRVHEAYQSFFPPDVYYVADHARRSMSEYPLAQGHYYGVNYGERGRTGIPQNEIPRQYVPPHCGGSGSPDYAPNDLSFYGNIPVPTSYMCMGSKEDFFGGYDYKAQAGIVHVASHHIAPGKKQWTWGNQEFGYAWDRNLVDADASGEFAPYIEIMSGVYTDNQPDFSFLQPGETRIWSQFWYPIQKIGPAQHANLAAAVALKVQDGKIRLGISTTRKISGGKISLSANGKKLFSITLALAPDSPFVKEIKLPRGTAESGLLLRVTDAAGNEIISYQPKPRAKGEVPPPATEPPLPEKISSADELFITGLHLSQYRHATRCPTLYWREALRRDPLDSRCNNGMGLWHLRRGEFIAAEKHFRRAIERLTRRNANPYDGEAYYNLGLCLRFLDRDDEAVDAFYKATWNQAWSGASFHALAELECRKQNWPAALEHLVRSLRFDTDNLRARDLKAIVLQKLNRAAEAKSLLDETLALDPLDWWARLLKGEKIGCDLQTQLDLAHDFARAGLYSEAISLLKNASTQAHDLPDLSWGAQPLLLYTLGWLHEKLDDKKTALADYRRAAAIAPDYCFPARLEEIVILQSAIRANPRDARAPYYLGNLLYDRRRHAEAIQLWEKSAKLDPKFSIVWRNLGIGWCNISKKPAAAAAAYEKAFAADRTDGRLLFERDQLWKRLGESPEKRLRALEKFPGLTGLRDDLSVELCALYNQTRQPAKALQILGKRRFQPWEGGEGAALGQHVRTNLALGRDALAQNQPAQARKFFEAALASPESLGETKHLLANQSDIHFWLGCAFAAAGEIQPAREHWLAAANFKGDFQEMSVRAFSEMTYYSARAREKLGERAQAKKLFRELLAYAQRLQKSQYKIDYFATSLPTMLLFDDDLQYRQETSAMFMQAQAQLGLGSKSAAGTLLQRVLRRDPNHALAADFAQSLDLYEKHEPCPVVDPGAVRGRFEDRTRAATNGNGNGNGDHSYAAARA